MNFFDIKHEHLIIKQTVIIIILITVINYLILLLIHINFYHFIVYFYKK